MENSFFTSVFAEATSTAGRLIAVTDSNKLSFPDTETVEGEISIPDKEYPLCGLPVVEDVIFKFFFLLTTIV